MRASRKRNKPKLLSNVQQLRVKMEILWTTQRQDSDSNRRHRRYWPRHRQSSYSRGRSRDSSRPQPRKAEYGAERNQWRSSDRCDVAAAEGVHALIEQVPDIDILINNLGIYEPKNFADITDADWFSIFETNVLSGVRRYFPRMLHRDNGRVIFISSEAAIMTPPEMIHYGVTKTSLLAISSGRRSLPRERVSPSTLFCRARLTPTGS